jgi:hypothetical protein
MFPMVKAKGCQSLSSNMRLRIPENSLYTCPNGMIVCGKMQLLEGSKDTYSTPR